MNVYKISDNVITLTIWNVTSVGNLEGHYQVFFDSNVSNILVNHHGTFGGLLWYPETNDDSFISLSPEEEIFIRNVIKRRLNQQKIFDYPYDIFGHDPLYDKAIKHLKG